MPTNDNAASRVAAILRRAVVTGAPSMKTLAVWLAVFDVDEPSPERASIHVARLLGVLHDEAELVRHQIRGRFTPEQYGSVFEQIDRALAATSFTDDWPRTRAHLNDHTLGLLGSLSEMLESDQGQPVDQPALAALTRTLLGAYDEIAARSLAAPSTEPVLRHIRIMVWAIEVYPITGDRALVDALGQAAAEAVTAPDAFREVSQNEETKEAWQRVRSVWHFFRDAVPVIDFIYPIYQNVAPFLLPPGDQPPPAPTE